MDFEDLNNINRKSVSPPGFEKAISSELTAESKTFLSPGSNIWNSKIFSPTDKGENELASSKGSNNSNSTTYSSNSNKSPTNLSTVKKTKEDKEKERESHWKSKL